MWHFGNSHHSPATRSLIMRNTPQGTLIPGHQPMALESPRAAAHWCVGATLLFLRGIKMTKLLCRAWVRGRGTAHPGGPDVRPAGAGADVGGVAEQLQSTQF